MDISKKIYSTLVIVIFFCLHATSVFAFTEDICFKNKSSAEDQEDVKIRNCLPVPKSCKTDELSLRELMRCKEFSIIDFFTAPRRMQRIDGARSLLHFDATYYLAQIIGYTVQDAYEIALYDQIADNGKYIPFDQKGNPLLSDIDILRCEKNRTANDLCLLTTPPLNGIKRDNFLTGGILLHLGARYATMPTPPQQYPFNYFTTPDIEKILFNLKDWAFGNRSTLCVAGVTDDHQGCMIGTNEAPIYINGYMPILQPGRMEYAELNVKLGNQIVNSEIDLNGNIIPESVIYSNQLDDYVKPHKGSNARLGIFLHSLQDRYSHHNCYDLSYYFKDNATQHYKLYYDNKNCDQGTHILSHIWETGTHQNEITNAKNITLKPALSATYDLLLEYAKSHGITVRAQLNKDKIVEDLISTLEKENAKMRLDALVLLFEMHGLKPLPGHGKNRM